MKQANTVDVKKPNPLTSEEAAKAFVVAICSLRPEHGEYHASGNSMTYVRDMQDDHHQYIDSHVIKVTRYKKELAEITFVERHSFDVEDPTFTIKVVSLGGEAVNYDHLKSALRHLSNAVMLKDYRVHSQKINQVKEMDDAEA